MTALRDDEDTVKVRRDSIAPSGVFSAKRPASLQPDPSGVHSAVDQHEVEWRAEISRERRENRALREEVDSLRHELALVKQTEEALRHEKRGLIDENAALRDRWMKDGR